MGRVYRGYDQELQMDVAIKVLRPEIAADARLMDRFRQECKIGARLAHPNITRFYTLLRSDDRAYMVMELVRGEQLDQRLLRSGRIPPPEALSLFSAMLDAFDYAHRSGVVHRDIKPSNIMVTGEGTVKVMDFGIARVIGSSRLTEIGAMVGTLHYMSPEQVLGEEGDARADIYALGIVLCEMLTGSVPFHRTSGFLLQQAHVQEVPPTLRELCPDPAVQFPPAWDRIIQKALDKDPNNRFQSAAEFRQALHAASTAPAAAEAAPSGWKALPAWVWASGLAAVLVAVLAAYQFWPRTATAAGPAPTTTSPAVPSTGGPGPTGPPTAPPSEPAVVRQEPPEGNPTAASQPVPRTSNPRAASTARDRSRPDASARRMSEQEREKRRKEIMEALGEGANPQ